METVVVICDLVRVFYRYMNEKKDQIPRRNHSGYIQTLTIFELPVI